MTVQRDGATQAALDRLLAEYGLSKGTPLYREAMRSALSSTGRPGIFRLAANARPAESVIDVYGNGHLIQAEQVGPGLAFAESAQPNWQETMELRTLKEGKGDHVEVETTLGDILSQGGLLYPVESVTEERAWYCTLPAGSVEVREVTL